MLAILSDSVDSLLSVLLLQEFCSYRDFVFSELEVIIYQ